MFIDIYALRTSLKWLYKLINFFAQTAQSAFNKNDFLLFTRPLISRSPWYRRFIKQFETYVVREIHNPTDKLDMLISFYTGEARENIADVF